MKKLSDSVLKQIILDPAVQAKMVVVIRLMGKDPHGDPLMQSAQVAGIYDHLKNQYKKKVGSKFVNQSAFKNFQETSDFDAQAENYADEQLYQKGFMGFDDHETEHLNFLPLAGLAAKFGGKLIKGAIQKVGGAIKKGIENKLLHKQEADQAQAEADHAQTVASAVQAGIPASVVSKITSADLLSSGSSTDRPLTREEGLQLADAIMFKNKQRAGTPYLSKQYQNFDAKATAQKALDTLKKGVQNYKDSEKAKTINKNLPIIIGVAILLIIVGWYVAKKA